MALIDQAERRRRREAAAEAEAALEAFRRRIPDRPTRGSAYKPTEADLKRWQQENEEHERLLTAYREAVQHSLHPEPIPCGQPREGGCNCTWGTTHVCNRVEGHLPVNPYPEARPGGGHCCYCGVSIPVNAPQVRPARALKPQEAAA